MKRGPVAGMLSALCVIMASSCINVNVPIGGEGSSSAVVWALEVPDADPWGVSSDYVIRVKDFGSVTALQRVEMTVELENGSLNRAGADVWSARPMELLPDALAADLMAAGCWGAVLRQATMLTDDFIVEGYIRGFGGEESMGVWSAVLDVDVTVLNGYDNTLVFQKNYDLRLDLSEPSYGALASGMAELVAIFDEEVMGDVWSAMLPVR